MQSEQGLGSDTASSEETEGPRGDAGGGDVASDLGLGGQRAGHRGMGEKAMSGRAQGQSPAAAQTSTWPARARGPEI